MWAIVLMRHQPILKSCIKEPAKMINRKIAFSSSMLLLFFLMIHASSCLLTVTSASAAAYNSIDGCWRGDDDWAADRMRLAGCAIGFGRGTTGGAGGRYYVVTDDGDDATDPAPGTLRYGVIQEEPLWIYFARSMTIVLENELIVTSDKTIDGRGADVHIARGPCLTIQFVSNVIVHGLSIHGCTPAPRGRLVRSSVSHVGYREGSDGDAITVFGSRNVWIDHNSLSSCADGLVDVIHASSLVTISNNFFSNHDKVMLLGHSDAFPADAAMKVTVAFNHFGPGLVQRLPRCRFGYVHVLNNDYTDGWGIYAIGGSAAPTIISQGNRFRASAAAAFKEVTKREDTPDSEWRNWRWRSIADTFIDGAYFVQSGPTIDTNDARYDDDALQNSGNFAPYLTASAGPLSCSAGVAC